METQIIDEKNNKNESQLQINLKDFPDDVYILLEDEFRAKFFKTAWKINRSYRHLAKKIGVANPTMLSWRRGRINYTNRDQYCPIWAIREIISYSEDSNNTLFDFRTIEKNIKCIRARHGRLKIYNPKLPIKDSIELREIMTHLLCDGYASIKKHTTLKYDLTSLEAIQEFKNELNIFGDIPKLKIREYTPPKPKAKMYRLNFPKAITKILSNKFQIDFSWDKGRFPKEFFYGDRKLLIAIVRAFLIDEGHIKDLSVKFSSNNLHLLQDLELICSKLGYKTLSIKKCRTCYMLPLSTKSFLKIYNDLMSIAPLPIIHKQKRLELALKLLNKRYIHFDVKSEIVNLLKIKPMTTSELCEKIIARRNNINNHLHQLKRKNLVEICSEKLRGKGGEFIWKLNYQSCD